MHPRISRHRSNLLIHTGNLEILVESTKPCTNDRNALADVHNGDQVSIRKVESIGFTWPFVVVSAASTRPHGLEVNNKATCVNMNSPELIATASGAVKARFSRGLFRRHQVVDLRVIGPRASS